MPSVDVFHWDELPARADAGVERRLVPGHAASLKQVRIEAGTRAERHSHPHEQFLLVLQGTGRLECATGAVDLRPGTVLRLAPDAWHSALFETETVLVEVNLEPGR